MTIEELRDKIVDANEKIFLINMADYLSEADYNNINDYEFQIKEYYKELSHYNYWLVYYINRYDKEYATVDDGIQTTTYPYPLTSLEECEKAYTHIPEGKEVHTVNHKPE